MPSSSRVIKPATSIDSFLANRRDKDLLRVVVCGNVNNGKSTLIGRLLWEAGALYDDQYKALRLSAGHCGGDEKFDFSLLVDGLQAERDQRITIDVAYRFLTTNKRYVVISDSPGHEEYTRNMVTAASNSDAGILLIDVCEGIGRQTRKHAALLALMGIRDIVVVVNKMDMVSFDEISFRRVVNDFGELSKSLGFVKFMAVPVSANLGENICQSHGRMPWYKGPTVLNYLERVPVRNSKSERAFFSVQSVLPQDYVPVAVRGIVIEGCIRVGDRLRVAATRSEAEVVEIVTMSTTLDCAAPNRAVTLFLEPAIHVQRGDVLCNGAVHIQHVNRIYATLVWLDDEPAKFDKCYYINVANQWGKVRIDNIDQYIEKEVGPSVESISLSMNEMACCWLTMTEKLVIEIFDLNRVLGGFILVDPDTNNTVCAGMIRSNMVTECPEQETC